MRIACTLIIFKTQVGFCQPFHGTFRHHRHTSADASLLSLLCALRAGIFTNQVGFCQPLHGTFRLHRHTCAEANLLPRLWALCAQIFTTTQVEFCQPFHGAFRHHRQTSANASLLPSLCVLGAKNSQRKYDSANYFMVHSDVIAVRVPTLAFCHNYARFMYSYLQRARCCEK